LGPFFTSFIRRGDSHGHRTAYVGGVAVIDLSGRFALGDGDGLLRDKVQSLVFQGVKDIALNLGGLSYMDGAGSAS
jgi:anti-sigma B factor antagonist